MDRGVDGHFDHPFDRPWVTIDEEVVKKSARVVGKHLTRDKEAS
jgi:kynureninase